jgi:hypothetical protein
MKITKWIREWLKYIENTFFEFVFWIDGTCFAIGAQILGYDTCDV